jgi:hypothetical protein
VPPDRTRPESAVSPLLPHRAANLVPSTRTQWRQ